MALSNEQLQTIVFWMMGSLTLTDWSYTQVVFPVISIAVVIAYFFSRDLNMLGLGEEAAHHSGVSVQRSRIIMLVLASLITGAAVSVSGAIGFGRFGHPTYYPFDFRSGLPHDHSIKRNRWCNFSRRS